jgi:citrate lyase subunit beta/citryl-CoA lyase
MGLTRTWMFVPGCDLKKIEKARGLGSDIIIYDLEDAVPLSEKAVARHIVKLELQANMKQINYVRINGSATSFYKEDLEEIIHGSLQGIMLPKSESAEQIVLLDAIINRLEQERGIPVGTIEIVPLIESALGLYNTFAIASSVHRVRRLAFGSIDFALDINAQLTKDGIELLFARSQLVAMSRAAGIEAPIDTVFIDIQDSSSLMKETAFIKQLGFQGKLVIHPSQIGIVNEVFTPTKGEVADASLIVSCFHQAVKEGLGALQVKGKMVDQPVVERAKKTLEIAELLGLSV